MLEIGCGSGIVAHYIKGYLDPEQIYIATDLCHLERENRQSPSFENGKVYE